MDEEDDNWSYSFPPSTEDLINSNQEYEGKLMNSTRGSDTLNSTKVSDGIQEADIRAKHLDENDAPFTRSPTARVSERSFFEYNPADEIADNPEKITISDMVSQTIENLNSSGVERNELTSKKMPSLRLSPAFASKSTPADPQTTRKDASSIISKENASNALASEAECLSPSESTLSRNDLKDSLRIWQQRQSEGNRPSNTSDTGSGSEFMESNSPKIITYRKTTHERKTSNNLKAIEGELGFDPKLYVDEFYSKTNYRYATMKRNVEFHQIFKSIDLTNRLLDDFACAISREILLQGRIYVTEHCLCFNSNLLGWVTSLVIPFSDIVRIDKKSTAGLFPNGIIVETKSSKHTFASFLSRDATFDFIRVIWSAATGRDIADLDSNPTKDSMIDPRNNTDKQISDFIMTIDEGDNADTKWIAHQTEDYEDEHTDASTDCMEDGSLNGKQSQTGVIPPKNPRSLRPGSVYVNRGPDFHTATVTTFEPDDIREEIEVSNEIIEAPLGVVFEILFGSENTKFHKSFLEDQGATNITEYGKFQLESDEANTMERSFAYQRPLGYSIGPKSTKCCVKELIEFEDLNNSVVVRTITDTPDVPSGGSFSVMTRFYFTWGNSNATQLRIAYYIKWTGRSWIRSMVEKSTHSAQVAASDKLSQLLRRVVEEEMEITKIPKAQTPTYAGVNIKRSSPPETSIMNKEIPPIPVVEQSYWMVYAMALVVISNVVVLTLFGLRLNASILRLNKSLDKQEAFFESFSDWFRRNLTEAI